VAPSGEPHRGPTLSTGRLIGVLLFFQLAGLIVPFVLLRRSGSWP
jgi:hypothetical protein